MMPIVVSLLIAITTMTIMCTIIIIIIIFLIIVAIVLLIIMILVITLLAMSVIFLIFILSPVFKFHPFQMVRLFTCDMQGVAPSPGLARLSVGHTAPRCIGRRARLQPDTFFI